MTKSNPMADLLRHEADLLRTGSDLHFRGLDLLVAEMRALAAILPGMATPHQTEAETEAGFDNLPL